MTLPRPSVTELAERLFEEFSRLVPLQHKAGKRRPTEAELQATYQKALAGFFVFAYRERQQYRLGIIARGRVAFKLQERLLQAGYSDQLVKKVLFALLVNAFVGQHSA